MTHKTIDGVGGKVHYWISFPATAEKQTLVFTHGLTANHEMYEKQVDAFKDKYPIIVWDVPMHGLSVPYSHFSYENAAKDLNAIIEKENIESVVLVGMSMGGYVCQIYAHRYPEKVLCFIGIDTTPFGTSYYSKADFWWLSKVKPMAKWFGEKTLRWSIAKSVSVTDYSYQKMMEMLAPLSKEQIIDQMDIAYGAFARECRDIHLVCPVLILLGDRDRTGKVRQYCMEWTKKTGYPLRIIRNAAHFSNGDNAEQVHSEMEQFIHQVVADDGKYL